MTLNSKQLKKLPYQLAILLLTGGASLILGFLSFGGMFALWPVLPAAFATFALSVAYEGEIYKHNITSALNKLFKHNFLRRQVAKSYLLDHFPESSEENRPQFFKDYEEQLLLLHQFGDKKLDKESRVQKKRVEKTLKMMEKWFAVQFFHKGNADGMTPYKKELQEWLKGHDQGKWQADFIKKQYFFKGLKAFSALAAVFMGLGTTYLLMEAFTTIPLLTAISASTLPFIIVPMSIIAGAAYGLLTYNAVTDLVSNNTIGEWYKKIRNDLQQEKTFKNISMAVAAIALVGLAVALTICTAGTWWTVAKETKPLFNWMSRMPGFIMGIINPIITGLSAVAFNLQNTSETLEQINEAAQRHDHKPEEQPQSDHDVKSLFKRENLLQIINPFRLLLKLTFTPLTMILFVGHLISIAVTADRVPGMSQIKSALLGFISEFFEDAHYFNPYAHAHQKLNSDDPKELLQERFAEHEHSHDDDLPTQALKVLFSPLMFLAAGWDYLTSKLNNETMSFSDAWSKQSGEEKETHLDINVGPSSTAWQKEQVTYQIDHHIQKQLQGAWIGRHVANTKREHLNALKREILEDDGKIAEKINTATNDETYSQHRFFAQGETSTQSFLKDMAENCTPAQ